MPDEDYWDSFFEPDRILERLGLSGGPQNVLEFGCGYGTFTIPAAKRVSGVVHALDIEQEMLDRTLENAGKAGVDNVRTSLRDFVAEGSGLSDGQCGYAMIFNILHLEDPVELLREARRNLQSGGRLGIIHWIYDEDTPRGPPMSMRPRPEQCLSWAEEAGFMPVEAFVELPPYHYGLVLKR